MADFQASNWTRTAVSDHALQYFPSSQGFGITAATVAANTTAIYTLTASFQFQGNGQCEASIPPGSTALQTGVSLGECYLVAPASGSYSAGNHPLIKFKSVAQIAATIAAASVMVVQY
jgi:hypothetical protein